MSNLNPDQFFHGTPFPIKDGVVRPVSDTNHEVSEYSMGDPGGMSEGDHAFVARNDERYAWHAAKTFHPEARTRARVYETEAAPDMKPGPWNKEHPDFLEHHELDIPEGHEHLYDMEVHAREVAKAQKGHTDEWGSPTGFKIKGRIDTMPGRQGTFPEVNWNRFSERGFTHGYYDTNHPSNEQVRFGMQGQETTLKQASHMNNEITEERRPKRRGAALKAYFMGEPEPHPLADHPKLF